ncbi:hypothetical protein [Ruegeria sp. AU67]|uniref:hypothetical protein n=1 Tax=Ruegeria sp. AU67 TaxID=2108530 RepID=UPI001358C7BB|nr:hypothetical protein [Ruegeria sp. AU67]
MFDDSAHALAGFNASGGHVLDLLFVEICCDAGWSGYAKPENGLSSFISDTDGSSLGFQEFRLGTKDGGK